MGVNKRIFDLALAATLAVFTAPLLLIVAMVVKLTSKGPVLYWSDRVGAHNRIFSMPKFRSMYTGTPEVATHLLTSPASHVTKVGGLLRKTSIDELPQLWSILRGDLSFVGPRPALFNQDDLVALRTAKGVSELVPGVTGWAQVNGRDDLSIPEKVRYDTEYLQRRSMRFDILILFLTFKEVWKSRGIHH